MSALLITGCAIAMVVGLFGVVVPVLPGLLLCYGAVAAWAIFADAGWGRWLVLGLCTLWAVIGTVVKYVWPGQRMKDAGIPVLSMLAGLAGAVVGFFVIPFVGLPIGFVGGIWLAELRRHQDRARAWASTVEALKATGLSMLVELGTGALIALTWVAGLIFA
jgi:uncharacterized protein YqgC (DUF456 family)